MFGEKYYFPGPRSIDFQKSNSNMFPDMATITVHNFAPQFYSNLPQ